MDINDIVSITTKYSRLNFDEMRDGMEPKNYGAEIQADLNELAKKPKRRL